MWVGTYTDITFDKIRKRRLGRYCICNYDGIIERPQFTVFVAHHYLNKEHQESETKENI